MNKKNAAHKVEGEGSYEATRGYNKALGEHVKSGKTDAAAKKAVRALEQDPAGMKRAEEKAKRGPKQAR